MSDQDDKDREYDEAVARAIQHGTMMLNDVFRFNNKTHQVFGNRGPRFNSLEVVWGIITCIFTFILLSPVYFLLGDLLWPFSLPFIAIYSVIAGFFGRRFANTSPLAKKTGEGTGVWVIIQIRKLMASFIGLPIFPESFRAMRNKAYSIALDPPRNFDCIEWIGTAMAPRMPYDYDPTPGHEDEPNYVSLFPRGERQVVELSEEVYGIHDSEGDFIFGEELKMELEREQMEMEDRL